MKWRRKEWQREQMAEGLLCGYRHDQRCRRLMPPLGQSDRKSHGFEEQKQHPSTVDARPGEARAQQRRGVRTAGNRGNKRGAWGVYLLSSC